MVGVGCALIIRTDFMQTCINVLRSKRFNSISLSSKVNDIVKKTTYRAGVDTDTL